MASPPTSNKPLPHLVIDPTHSLSPLRSPPSHFHSHTHPPPSLPPAKSTKRAPHSADTSSTTYNASLLFIGTATTLLEWEGLRLMTDPNFLHAGDHVHLGPGVTGTRLTEPALALEEIPGVDVVLLSHYHEDHFDKKVEESLRRSLPIITTPHAKVHLANKPGEDEAFTAVYELDTFQSMMVDIQPGSPSLQSGPAHKVERTAAVKVTAMPGKHVPPGILGTLNDLVKAVPPINGWMLEFGYTTSPASNNQNIKNEKDTDTVSSFHCGYRIYISGDTLLVDDLKAIPERYAGQNIDLMLIHLGGTTIPSPSMPLLMVTMDAVQGLGLMRLINPDVTIPIHYDDYDVFLSPLEDFKKAVEEAGWSDKVVYLDRGDEFKFEVKG